MKYILSIVFTLNFITAMALEQNEFLALMPQPVYGWQAKDDGTVYDKSTLYDYIDGGAELYISYGFINVLSREYNREGQPSVYIEIFDMGSPANAFGVFSNTSENINAEIGQDGEYVEGLVTFWKNNFFVSVFADFENSESKKAIIEMAEQISGLIKGEGEKPTLVKTLPADNLDIESIVYTIHPAWQNYYHFISHENIFGISAKNDAVLAKYNIGANSDLCLVVKYENEKETFLQLESVNNYFNKKTGPSGFIDMGNNRSGKAFTVKNKLIFIIGANEEQINYIFNYLQTNL